ncbi:MAG: GDSL-type esterase/lipase family protein [Myxococcota bacterium]
MRLAAKISLAIGVSLLTLELCLQLASWVAPSEKDAAASVDEGGTRILCVGDSHTFGAGVFPKDNYPSQLQAVLDARYPEKGFRVFNLGLPGINSAHVARRLEAQLLGIRPAIVLVWVGTNNMWNELEREEGAGGGVHRALLRSKLYRLGTVLWHTRSGAFERLGQDDQEDERRTTYLGWTSAGQERTIERIEQTLATDMRRMVETSAALEVPIVFLTYPQERQQLPVSDLIERHALALGVPVVVTARDRERAEADGLKPGELFVFGAGPHPSPALYGYIVESLVPRIATALDFEAATLAK